MTALRQTAILDHLRSRGNASFSDLADVLKVSQETVRRDIRSLVNQGVVAPIRGGVALPEVLEQAAFHYCLLEEAGAKQQIAERAAQEVANKDTLLIGGGSTSFYFAAALRAHRELTVVTNSVDVARVLVSRGNNIVHTIGGQLRPLSGSSLGPRAVEALRDFTAAKAFFSVGTLGAPGGYMHDEADECAFTRALMARARTRYALVDTSKMGRDSLFVIAGFAEIETLITEASPPDAITTSVKAAGSRLIVAGQD